MSLLHKPHYDNTYTKEDDEDGLGRLLWSQFMCKCGQCKTSTGKDLMERLPVYILDDIAREERMRFDVELGYVCKTSADKIPLTSKNPHRVGLGVSIRILSSTKRIKLVRGLIVRGVTRIVLSSSTVSFDTDDLQPMELRVI